MRGHAHSRVSTQVMGESLGGRCVGGRQKRISKRRRVIFATGSQAITRDRLKRSEKRPDSFPIGGTDQHVGPGLARRWGVTITSLWSGITNVRTGSILLGLATIIRVLRFQALRLREIAGATGD